MNDIESKLQDHEERLRKIEELISGTKKVELKENKSYGGLSGGIELLIHQGFLDQLKSMDQIKSELHRLGYVYPRESINKVIFVNFMKKKQKLTRIKDGTVWKYAKRK